MIKSGDILLHKGTSFVSKIIQYGTKSQYSHVSVCVSDKMCITIEASAGLVRAQYIDNIESEFDIYRVRCKYEYNLNKVIKFLASKLNSKYDYAGVIYLGFLKLLKLKDKANIFQKKEDYFCSELVYEAFMCGGLDIVPNIESSDITSPADIANSPRIRKISRTIYGYPSLLQ